jgi:hypothetical protein
METGGVTGQASAHLAACASCRSHAVLLGLLGGVAPRPADDADVERIMAALSPAPWQRRTVNAWLPLAAGLALVVVGLVLLGGVPAQMEVASLPGVAGGFLAKLASIGLDAVAAAKGGADLAQVLAAASGAWLLVWLALAAAGGSWAVVAMAGRRRAGARR